MDLNNQKILISEQPTVSRIELRHRTLNCLVQVQGGKKEFRKIEVYAHLKGIGPRARSP